MSVYYYWCTFVKIAIYYKHLKIAISNFISNFISFVKIREFTNLCYSVYDEDNYRKTFYMGSPRILSSEQDNDTLGDPDMDPRDEDHTALVSTSTQDIEGVAKGVTDDEPKNIALKLILCLIAIPVVIIGFFLIFNWLKRKYQVKGTQEKVSSKIFSFLILILPLQIKFYKNQWSY